MYIFVVRFTSVKIFWTNGLSTSYLSIFSGFSYLSDGIRFIQKKLSLSLQINHTSRHGLLLVRYD